MRMMFRLSNVVCCLVLLTLLAGPGCRQLLKRKQKPTPTPANPLADPNFVAPDYVSRAIDAAGGRRAWAGTRKLQFDCVATFYQPDGSSYMTRQRHEVYPWKNSIRISGREPSGSVVWEFSGREAVEFLRADPAVWAGRPLESLSQQQFAAAILKMVTAPVRLLDQPRGTANSLQPVRITGRWYDPIQKNDSQETESAAGTVFYQNRDNALIEALRLPEVRQGTSLVVRGYDYPKFREDVVLVPTKIEILQTDAEGPGWRRLAILDCHSFQFLP
jgi:hypothetical protein